MLRTEKSSGSCGQEASEDNHGVTIILYYDQIFSLGLLGISWIYWKRQKTSAEPASQFSLTEQGKAGQISVFGGSSVWANSSVLPYVEVLFH